MRLWLWLRKVNFYLEINLIRDEWDIIRMEKDRFKAYGEKVHSIRRSYNKINMLQ